MMSYRKIIEGERAKLNKSINWWPLYLYHFTDVHNAISIIDKEYIFGRKLASDENLMTSDNASSNVIEITDEMVLRYARLYMRPKTPTQFHNEGYKPEAIRDQGINANCPVPVFFFLDAEKVLSLDGVQFVEKGLAGHHIDNSLLLSGEEQFSKLNFEKIFHNGSFPPGSDIKQFRHTEVIRQDGIPISNLIRGIACRSIAEKQTLLYMLKKTSNEKYNKYKNIISYKPEIDIFYNNGIFIRKVGFIDGTLYLELNDSNNRYNRFSNNRIDVDIQIHITWLGNNLEVLGRSSGSATIDYREVLRISFTPKTKINKNYALLDVRFDNYLMYNNIIQIREFEII
ncbi:MAG: DUF4433 domain-containing protein [Tissierellaceae bacterium]|nr:DUF4433 domain-containing protein [Tissierellaceae bacterium]